MKAASFVNLFLLALVAGIFWGTWFSLSRSIASITPQTFLEVGRTMIQNLGGPMRLLMPAAILSFIPVLFGLFRRHQRAALFLASTGLALFILALLVTLLVNVPIDSRIHQWTLATLPRDWEAIRDRWEFYHTVRTFAALAGLGCALASALCAPASLARETRV
jgi:uncharacterized membrane protein